MPAAPDVKKLAGVAGGRHDPRDVFKVDAFRLIATRAVLTAAVGAFHRVDDAGQFGSLFRVGGRRQRQRHFEQFELAREIGRHLQLVEARGAFGQVHGGGDGALVLAGGQGLGVFGDVGGFDPIGTAGGDVEVEQRLLGLVHEGLSLGDGRGFLGTGGKGGGRTGNQDRGQ